MTILCRIAAGAMAVGMLLGSTGMGRSEQRGGLGSTQQTQGQVQNPSTPPVTAAPPIFGQDTGPMDRGKMEQEQAKSRNIDRQKRIVDDTAKLLTLANELKLDVDKTDKNTLSLDVIKKADEIEKLAHNVKERMKE
jgi:hypothetical protein